MIPCVKQIDILAAKFPANTNYLYMTYYGDPSDVPAGLHSPIIEGADKDVNGAPSITPTTKAFRSHVCIASDLSSSN